MDVIDHDLTDEHLAESVSGHIRAIPRQAAAHRKAAHREPEAPRVDQGGDLICQVEPKTKAPKHIKTEQPIRAEVSTGQDRAVQVPKTSSNDIQAIDVDRGREFTGGYPVHPDSRPGQESEGFKQGIGDGGLSRARVDNENIRLASVDFDPGADAGEKVFQQSDRSVFIGGDAGVSWRAQGDDAAPKAGQNASSIPLRTSHGHPAEQTRLHH